MLVALGIATIVVVVVGVVVVMALARKQVEGDAPPASGAEFVAPVSSGQYRFREPDESPEEFKARVDRENEAIASSRRGEQLTQPK